MKKKNKKNEAKTSKLKGFFSSLSDNTSKLNRVDVKILLLWYYGVY